jgi:inorganic pyrophosphatase
MTLEDKVNQLESRLNNLQNAFLLSQKNQVPITAKTDDTANKVVEITPWTASKMAYIDDTSVSFENVPTGNMTVYCSVPHTAERDGDRVTVRFEPLEEVINITISVI